jgi:DNA-binding IclR family transcriptional regulator
MTWRAREERHADPRAPHGQRVMSALMQAQGQTMTLAQLKLVAGMDAAQVLRALDPLVAGGTVVPLGDLRYQLRQPA